MFVTILQTLKLIFTDIEHCCPKSTEIWQQGPLSARTWQQCSVKWFSPVSRLISYRSSNRGSHRPARWRAICSRPTLLAPLPEATRPMRRVIRTWDKTDVSCHPDQGHDRYVPSSGPGTWQICPVIWTKDMTDAFCHSDQGHNRCIPSSGPGTQQIYPVIQTRDTTDVSRHLDQGHDRYIPSSGSGTQQMYPVIWTRDTTDVSRHPDLGHDRCVPSSGPGTWQMCLVIWTRDTIWCVLSSGPQGQGWCVPSSGPGTWKDRLVWNSQELWSHPLMWQLLYGCKKNSHWALNVSLF